MTMSDWGRSIPSISKVSSWISSGRLCIALAVPVASRNHALALVWMYNAWSES